ncbi:exopolysaccharide biosynthesis polyprenyl glycosylphosphotransferase [Streptomyces sp. NPDC013953]|uniref:exopolysaccharide biosynthesis polyprenyl glycosylphosphotransferase n=1 Tax=Streptomyces sp. NPDC013953 TaxID=3364868 RepID=UPI003702D09B
MTPENIGCTQPREAAPPADARRPRDTALPGAVATPVVAAQPADPGQSSGAAPPARAEAPATAVVPGPGNPGARVTVGPPRTPVAADPVVPPPRRHPAAAPFSPALVAADCVAVLVGALFLTPAQRDAALLMQLTLCVAVLNAHAGLHGAPSRPGVLPSVLDELPALAARAAVAWCAAAALLAACAPRRALGLAALAAAYAAHLAFVTGCRAVAHHRRRRAVRARPRPVLVAGPVPAAQRLAATLAEHPEYGLRPVGIVESPRGNGGPATLPVLTTAEEIHRAVVRNGVTDVLFAHGKDEGGQTGGGGTERPDLVALLRRHGCASWLAGAPDGSGGGAMNRHLWGFSCRRLDVPHDHGTGSRPHKRLLDLALAGPLLLALVPLLLLCAAAIRLSDGPGVLFRQERVGQHGRPFTLLKFRTLRPRDEHEAATRWSVAHDERLSGVGALLRRTSLDELPQLWNVLRGDMSLVGPRPERPYFVDRFSRLHPGYAARHRMPAGLTGLAQVHGLRGDTSIEDRCRFDNHYIDHWSLWQDVCILLRTAASLFRPAGS